MSAQEAEYERLVGAHYPDSITEEIADRMLALEAELGIETLVPDKFRVPRGLPRALVAEADPVPARDDRPPPGFFYALHVKCVGGCLKECIGPRRRDDEEFPPETIEAFFAAVREHGWVERDGGWRCGEDCSGFPFDLSKFKIRQGLLTEYTIKTINPDFYGTVTIANLGDEGGDT